MAPIAPVWTCWRFARSHASALARKKPDIKKTTGISDEEVRSKTGRAWADWSAILDLGGAAQLKHKEIAKHL